MNIVKLMGGLGNQLFQYSFGRTLSYTNRKSTNYDISWYLKAPKSRPYRLEDMGLIVPLENFNPKYTLFRETSYDKNLLRLNMTNFYGYWQYLKYHEIVIPELQKEIAVPIPLTKYRGLFTNNYVALHVRRGDYEGTEFILPLEYYESALSEFQGMRIKVMVFSDDIPWCMSNLPDGWNYTYIQDSDIISFYLMSLCHHVIISRSTFSWWAAILNMNEGKKVVCPERFIVRPIDDKKGYDNKIHYPDEWIKI